MSDSLRKILIVDDDRDIRLLLNFILSKAGYTVVQAVNGAEALEIVKQHTLNLIISDVKMPVMDGYELVKKLREVSETSGIPILLLTGNELVRVSPEELEYPPDDYLSKPFNAGDLMPKIKKLLSSPE
ncbi:MAG: response regulator [Proteobacteria bacterium]|nr:response regulator [Pseudomonadota bacterium]